MIVGVVKEIKRNEYRVGLTPQAVSSFVSAGHKALIETTAGEGAGFDDAEYTRSGAEIVAEAGDVWEKSDMIVKVKEPVASEYGYFRDGLILYAYLHLAANRPLTDALLASGVKAVAYETITDEHGGLPCLVPMSIIAGRMSVSEGAKYIQKPYDGRGVLLSGIPGVEKGKVTIIGGGIVGTEACKIAVGLGAETTILDISASRLSYIDNHFGSRVQTLRSTPENIRRSVADSDVVVGAVLIPGKKAPKLILKEDLSLMKKGSVIVDVAVDQGGCFETTKPTTHQDPIFVVDGVVHYCVANMPGALPRTATLGLVNTTLDYGLDIADKGFEAAIGENKYLMTGVNTYNGKITFEGVAESLDLKNNKNIINSLLI
jgi:alanine dehydrogenase